MEYGTGAIMAVPGHDERDFEFARRFELPIVRVVGVIPSASEGPCPLLRNRSRKPIPTTTNGVLVNSGQFDGLTVPEAKRAITAWLAERGAGKATVSYRLHDWCISRQRYWGPPIPIIYCDEHGTVPVPEKDLPVAAAADRRLPARRQRHLPAGPARGVVLRPLSGLRQAAAGARPT